MKELIIKTCRIIVVMLAAWALWWFFGKILLTGFIVASLDGDNIKGLFYGVSGALIISKLSWLKSKAKIFIGN